MRKQEFSKRSPIPEVPKNLVIAADLLPVQVLSHSTHSSFSPSSACPGPRSEQYASCSRQVLLAFVPLPKDELKAVVMSVVSGLVFKLFVVGFVGRFPMAEVTEEFHPTELPETATEVEIIEVLGIEELFEILETTELTGVLETVDCGVVVETTELTGEDVVEELDELLEEVNLDEVREDAGCDELLDDVGFDELLTRVELSDELVMVELGEDLDVTEIVLLAKVEDWIFTVVVSA